MTSKSAPASLRRMAQGSSTAKIAPHMTGTLVKRGSAFPFTWKRRHFALLPEGLLRYYESASAAEPKGEVTVVAVRERPIPPNERLLPDEDGSHGLSFVLDAGSEMLIRAPTSAEQARWLLALDQSPQETLTLAEERGRAVCAKMGIEVSAQHAEPEVLLLLEQTWSALTDGEPFEPKGKQWSRLGFQGLDPLTDFRGGGRLAVENLHYLATQHTAEARATLHRLAQSGDDAKGVPRAFPWACGSINVTSVLAGCFFDPAADAARWPEALALHGSRFEELHCVAFLLLCQFWFEMPEATYFEFGRVLHALRERCGAMLKARRFPPSVSALLVARQSAQPLFEGWLVKLARHGAAARAMGFRTRRWVVLRGEALLYYEDASLAVEKGRLPLDGHLAQLTLKHNAARRALHLASASGAIDLFAESRSTYENWRAHLQRLVGARRGSVCVWEAAEIERDLPNLAADPSADGGEASPAGAALPPAAAPPDG